MSEDSSVTGSVHVRQADCIDFMSSLTAPPKLVIADPPYNIGYHYAEYADNLASDEYLKWCQRWLQAIYKCMAADGTFFLFSGERYASELDCLARSIGFIKRSRICWYFSFGQNQRKNFTPSHVSIFYFVRGKTYTFNANDPAFRVPSNRELVYADKRSAKKLVAGKVPDNVWLLTKAQYEGLLQPLDDMQFVSRVCGTFKVRGEASRCQLPASLVARLIRVASNRGDWVFDPFSGSGVVAAEAVRLGRCAAACDIDQRCVDETLRRLKNGTDEA